MCLKFSCLIRLLLFGVLSFSHQLKDNLVSLNLDVRVYFYQGIIKEV